MYRMSYTFCSFVCQTVCHVPGGTVYLVVSGEGSPALPITAAPQQDAIREHKVCSNVSFRILLLFAIL